MKRTASHRTAVAMVLGLAMTLPAPALAAPPDPKSQPTAASATTVAALKVTREQAIALAKQYFGISADLGEPNVNVYQNKDNASWNLSWYPRPDKVSQGPAISYNVTIDGTTGEVRGYNRSAPPSEELPEAKLTRQEAQQKAQTWLDLLAGSYESQMKLQDTQNTNYGYMSNASYSFNWQRTLYGYTVLNSGVTLTINANTGELENYNFNWNQNLAAPMPEAMLSKEKAEEIFRDKLALELQYQYFTTPGTDKGEWKLVYRPVISFPLITQDGKAVDYNAQEIDTTAMTTRTPVPAPDKAYVAPAHPLNREQALDVAKALSGKTDEPNNSSYNENGDSVKSHAWNFSWYNPTKDGEGNVNLAVDADRGVITNFNSWGPYQPLKEGEVPKVSRDDARKVAIDFLRNSRPDIAGRVVMVNNNNDKMFELKTGTRPASYSFQFAELHEGVRVQSRDTTVDVDVRTGAVRNFWANSGMDDKQHPFPAVDGIIPAAKAATALLANSGITANWNTFYQPNMGKDPNPAEPKTMLVWSLTQNVPVQAIDAKTGALLDWNGRDLVEAAKRPTDIEGHFAQREIELLWTRGIFELKGGKFNPNADVTAADLSRWLVMVKGMQPFPTFDFAAEFAAKSGSPGAAATLAKSEAAPYFGAAIRGGIILPEDFADGMDVNGPVSRELFALWSVRALGYSAIAKMPNQIEMPFADKAQIDAKYVNSVALLNGLGIVKGGSESKFEPKRNLTRGEAAKILYSLSNRPGNNYYPYHGK